MRNDVQDGIYRALRGRLDKIRPVRIPIGERRKPDPAGQPGYRRVDSVHQGDLDGIKGRYLIHAEDEGALKNQVQHLDRVWCCDGKVLRTIEA